MNSQNSKNADFNGKKPQIFDPSVEVKNILKLPSNERKLALENFYKNLEKYHADLVGVFNFARAEFGDLDLSNKTDEEIDTEIEAFLQKFGEKIENFDEKTKNKILEWIARYVKNKKNVYKKLKVFEENPLKFLQENGFKGESLDDLQGRIEVDEYRGNVVIYMDELDAEIFDMENVNGDYLGGIIRVVKYSKYYNTLIHENQHAENKIFLNDFYMKNDDFYEKSREYANRQFSFSLNVWTLEENNKWYHLALYTPRFEHAMIKFKDELLAQLKWWEDVENLKSTFMNGYDYFDYLKDWDNEEYEDLRSDYLNQIVDYIDLVKELIRQNVSLEILAITPIEKWRQLWRMVMLSGENDVKIVQNLWNWQKIMKKTFKNWEIWEGIFQDNRLLEWKKIIWDVVYEGKFDEDEQLIIGSKQYRDDWWEKIEFWEFSQDFGLIENGFVVNKEILFKYKNGEIEDSYLMSGFDFKRKTFSADIIESFSENHSLRKIWKFSIHWSELIFENGLLKIEKYKIPKFLESKIRAKGIIKKLKNFFQKDILEIEFYDREIFLDNKKIEEIEEFSHKNKLLDMSQILSGYGYATKKMKNIFKNLISKILQK